MSVEGPIAVLHVLGMLGVDRGGSAAATLAIAAATRDAGDHATILTTCGDEEVRAGPPGVEIVACPRRWPRHISFSRELTVWLWRNVRRFDLVEVHEVFAFPTLAVWAVSRMRGVPYAVHPHGSLDEYDMRKHALAKRVLRPGLRRMLRRAAGVWLTAVREEATLAHLGPGVRTVVSPLPVLPAEHTGDRAAFRDRYDLADDDRVALFLARLDPKKGLTRLITAFETAADTVDRARLVIAGSGPGSFPAEVRDRVTSSRHCASIRMVGFLSGQEKADALAGADLFVLHSDRENFGIAPVEALQAGTPVLLSDEVYLVDEPATAGAIEVVGIGDTAGLARRLGALLADACALRRRADAARAAGESFLPHRVAARDAALRRALTSTTRAEGAAPAYPVLWTSTANWMLWRRQR